MKKVKLTQGLFALVDDADYEFVSRYSWCAWRHRKTAYARRRNGKKVIALHQHMLPGASRVDHIDGNGLNNQRENLRVCTNSQNLCNRGRQKNNTLGFKGVSWNKVKGKWHSYAWLNGRRRFLGYFDDPVLAAKAYNTAVQTLHGEFARINFVA